MLDFLRRSSTSVFSWLILGLIAVAFTVSFGLPSMSSMVTRGTLVSVHTTAITDLDYRFQHSFARLTNAPRSADWLLESAVEREVLNRAARDMGLTLDEKVAEDTIADGVVLAFGHRYPWSSDETFNYNQFLGLLQQLKVQEDAFIDYQKRELVAELVRNSIAASAVPSEAELRRAYENDTNRLSLRYATFEHRDFADKVDPTVAEIEAWMQEHASDLEAAYGDSKLRFEGVPASKKVRLIEVTKDQDKAQATIKRAKQQIESGDDERTVARALSTHASAGRAGDLGWISIESGLVDVDPVVTEAFSMLEAGWSEVLEGASAYYLLGIDGVREGNTPKDEALRELAYEAVQRDVGQQRAQKAARDILAAIRAGTPEAELFGPESESGIEIRETGWFAKADAIPRLGDQPAIIDAVWTKTPTDTFVDRVFELDARSVIVALAERETASDEGFLAKRTEYWDRLQTLRGHVAAQAWTHWRCEDAETRGEIASHPERVAHLMADPKLPDLPAPEYDVCSRVGYLR